MPKVHLQMAMIQDMNGKPNVLSSSWIEMDIDTNRDGFLSTVENNKKDLVDLFANIIAAMMNDDTNSPNGEATESESMLLTQARSMLDKIESGEMKSMELVRVQRANKVQEIRIVLKD